MKKYRIGFMLSLAVFLLLLAVNAQLYHHVMHLYAPILFLTFHVMMYKHLIPEKRYGAYLFFVLMLGVSILFSFPEFTHQEARERILATYGQDMELREQDNLPLDRDDAWHPFAPRWGYAFVGTVPSSNEHTSFLFIPDTGKIFEIAP